MKTIHSSKISIVDDDEFSLTLIKSMLESINFTNLSTYSNSTDFLNSLISQPEIIFLDYHIDNLNGLEILKKIKRFNPETFIVFISGQENISIAVTALKYGAFDYLVKGQYSTSDLEVVMNKMASLKSMLHEKKNKSIFKKIKSSLNR